ncbi:MAG TPA: tetratricopeptide repeat protein [Thermohalobaculum sp.]|nr:tetratricopeptide repeat protein [Thermohalobaculum sp.]
MRQKTAVAFLTAVLAGAIGAGAGPAAAQGNDLENLLALCSDPATPPLDAYNACSNAAETGRLDARRRALVWMNAGIAAHVMGRYGDAVTAHGNAIKADPRLGAAFANRARAQDKLDRVAAALADFAAAISIEPKSVDAYLGRGALMLSRDLPERALPDFDRAVELAPEMALARYNRGLAHLQLGQFAEAEADFSAVIGKNPREAQAYLNRGRARAAQGSDKARGDFDRAVQLDQEWPVAWYLRGRYLDEQGDREGANASFLRAYQLGHSDPWLIERIRKISGG